MNHLAQVDMETHMSWGKDHNMTAYMGSAKTGD